MPQKATAAAARCSQKGCLNPPHPKSKKGYCAMCLGAAREAWRAKVKQSMIESAARREEAESILDEIATALEKTPRESTPCPATVRLTSAATSFAFYAKKFGQGAWVKPSKGTGLELACSHLALALAVREVLTGHDVECGVVVS